MANVKHVAQVGNQMKVQFDDGTSKMAYPTSGGIWIVSGNNSSGPSEGNFIWPFSTDTVSSEYGPRSGGSGSFHEGIDLAPGAGSNIPCSGDGVVETNELHPNFGNLCIVFHGTIDGKDIRTLYAHRQTLAGLQVGDNVIQGAILGKVGNTGVSFGAHLHFETHVSNVGAGITWNTVDNGGYRTAINPRDFMVEYNA
jgi:murein DD-endopeptidase MepM/ murein hydrolase activator NlpD